MREDEWTETLSRWAHAQPDIKALVQIGSRVQSTGTVDHWSDFDYQLVTTRPNRYADGLFASEISRCWAVGASRAFGNVTKISAIFEDTLEVDFVILRSWELRVATAALRWPKTQRWWPAILRSGTEDLRRVAGLGWKIIKGGNGWEKRYSRITPFRAQLTKPNFDALCGEFWSNLVWAAKKTERGEFFAAQRAFHEVLFEKSLRLLEEEGVLNGKAAKPFARRAEQWIDPQRLDEVKIPIAPNRESLFAALDRVSALFLDVSRSVAKKNGWHYCEFEEIRAWLAKHHARST